MDALFIKVLNISIAASWLILAVIAVRWLLKRSPRWITVVLWGIVALRLVMPFSIKAGFSLVPSAQTVRTEGPAAVSEAQAPPAISIDSGIKAVDDAVNPVIERITADTPKAYEVTGIPEQIDVAVTSDPAVSPVIMVPDSAAPSAQAASPVHIGSIVWLSGAGVILLYGIVSIIGLRRRVREATPQEGRIWLCDQVRSPFILGVIKPRIYLPSDLGEAERPYVLAHEQAHIKRGDHFVKPLSFLLLAVHWFNPLVWLAYILFCRDIEAACDEKVIGAMALESKKEYARALLSCSIRRRHAVACPLAFGEVAVSTRVKSVLNYKKPALIAIIAAAVCCAAVAACFLTDPMDKTASVIEIGTEDPASQGDPSSNGNDPANAALSIGEQRAKDYEWNASRTYAVAQLVEKTPAEAMIGSLAEGFPKDGMASMKLICEVPQMFNYSRLRDAADSEDALYQYFNIGQFAWVGGGSAARRSENRPGSFNGDITEEFLESLRASNTPFTYNIYLDWNYKDAVNIGDTVLIAIDPQVTINPNSTGTAYEIEDAKCYRAVAAPFASDSPQPHIAHFIDGKLQLSAKLQDAFDLRRLYNDTNPELTGIKDGDSVETVVNFLKAVEQDMIRYEGEMK